MKPLRGKHAVLTGAASGIGRALAIRLAEAGVRLTLIDRNAEALAETIAAIPQGELLIAKEMIDLTDVTALEAMILRLLAGEPIDLLINNAGVVHYGPSEAMKRDDLERLLAVNLLVPLRLTLALLPHLLARPQSQIVNMSSILGLAVLPHAAAYNASKFGLLGWSESLRREYALTNLGVTTVCPGFVSTNLFAAGTSSLPEGTIPPPPQWMQTSPDVVARRVVRAIEINKRLVLITPLAYVLYYIRRFAPWLPEAISRLRRLFVRDRTRRD